VELEEINNNNFINTLHAHTHTLGQSLALTVVNPHNADFDSLLLHVLHQILQVNKALQRVPKFKPTAVGVQQHQITVSNPHQPATPALTGYIFRCRRAYAYRLPLPILDSMHLVPEWDPTTPPLLLLNIVDPRVGRAVFGPLQQLRTGGLVHDPGLLDRDSVACAQCGDETADPEGDLLGYLACSVQGNKQGHTADYVEMGVREWIDEGRMSVEIRRRR
jgi:hypothetical protein